jgi:predicted MPP superfamily phosphohydrolase
MAPKWMSSIEAACSESELIVLGGDIFDFRWATLGGHMASLRAGRLWLNELLKKNPHARIVYILGNHDSHPDMQRLLEDLAEKSGRLQWYAESYQLGDCLFCHGDILDAGGQGRLAGYRRKFHHERQASRAAHGAYEVLVAMRLHRTIPTLFHRPRATCMRLSELLNLTPYADHSKVQRVFFGHTHIPIYELPLGTIQFFNPGAALRHLNFAPIQFEIDAQ